MKIYRCISKVSLVYLASNIGRHISSRKYIVYIYSREVLFILKSCTSNLIYNTAPVYLMCSKYRSDAQISPTIRTIVEEKHLEMVQNS